MTDFIARFDVRNQTTYGDYTQAKDAHGNLLNYCYRFWGGDNDDGSVTVSKSKDGDSVIVIRFVPGNDIHYNIQNVSIWSDPSKSSKQPTGPKLQFDFRPAWDRRGVTLYDRLASSNGKVPFDFCYSIEVNDTRPGQDPSVIIVCDPTIHNNTVS
jgi:hypothetical protein